MNGLEIARFIAVSGIAVAGLALLGGLVGDFATPVPGVPWAERKIEAGLGFCAGAASFAILALLLQFSRVVVSMRRSTSGTPVPFRQSWMELQTNLQAKACIVGLLLGIVGGLVTYVLFP